VVHVVFDPNVVNFDKILKVFFENHDPTQGNRQGNDCGSQYRSAIYTYTDTQKIKAQEAISRYEIAYGKTITTELKTAPIYYPAEDYHQQYLAKNPNGYCMHGPTGIVCEIPER
jgi:peptide-methionine (S)-S-oxide reductase